MKRSTKLILAATTAAAVGGGIFAGVEAFSSSEGINCAAYAPDASKFGPEINGPNGNNFDMFSQIGEGILHCAQANSNSQDASINSDNRGAFVAIRDAGGAAIELSVESKVPVNDPKFANNITDVAVSTFPQGTGRVADGITQWSIDYTPVPRSDDPLQSVLQWQGPTFPDYASVAISRDPNGDLYLQDQGGPMINDPANPEGIACSALQIATAAAGAMQVSPKSFSPFVPLLPGGPDTSGACARN